MAPGLLSSQSWPQRRGFVGLLWMAIANQKWWMLLMAMYHICPTNTALVNGLILLKIFDWFWKTFLLTKKICIKYDEGLSGML
jgi:hypothetical protein